MAESLGEIVVGASGRTTAHELSLVAGDVFRGGG